MSDCGAWGGEGTHRTPENDFPRLREYPLVLIVEQIRAMMYMWEKHFCGSRSFIGDKFERTYLM